MKSDLTPHDFTVTEETSDTTGRRWSMVHGQIDAHLRSHDTDPNHPFAKLPRGEVNAARDAANEHRKQRES